MHSVSSNAVAGALNEITARIKIGKAEGIGTGGWRDVINLGILEAGKYQFILSPNNITNIAISTTTQPIWNVMANINVYAPMLELATETELKIVAEIAAGVNYSVTTTVIKVA